MNGNKKVNLVVNKIVNHVYNYYLTLVETIYMSTLNYEILFGTPVSF